MIKGRSVCEVNSWFNILLGTDDDDPLVLAAELGDRILVIVGNGARGSLMLCTNDGT